MPADDDDDADIQPPPEHPAALWIVRAIFVLAVIGVTLGTLKSCWGH